MLPGLRVIINPCVRIRQRNWELKISKKLQQGRALSFFRQMTGISDDRNVKPVRNEASVKRASTKYVVYFDLKTNTICSRWDTKSDVKTLGIKDDLLRFMMENYRLDETGIELQCFTECLKKYNDDDTTIVRCHPNYQSKGPWNDWGMIRFQGSLRPAKFHALVDMDDGSVHAIVEVASGPPTVSGSVLTNSWPFPLQNALRGGTSYHCVNMRQYVRPSLVFQKKTSHEILNVLPFEKWYMKF